MAINVAVLTGRLTRDPELKKTPSNKSYSNFTIAVDNGANRETDFINCVAWNQTAELLTTYMRKGSLMGVNGRIQTRNYDDPNIPNRKVYVTEVVANSITFLESKNQQQSVQQTTQAPTYDFDDEPETFKVNEDDLPF